MSSGSNGLPKSRVDALLKGAIDLDCRSGPSIEAGQLTHDIAAEEAAAAGMAALAFRDDYYPTTPVARILEKTVFASLPVKLISGAVLNNYVGGLNPYAVEHELMLGGRIVWMPTLSAANHLRQSYREAASEPGARMRPREALSVIDAKGAVTDPVREILELIAERDAVLASGHLHASEIMPLFAAARSAGINRLLVNQPFRWADATLADIMDLANGGAFIELTAAGCIDGPDRRASSSVPAWDRCTISGPSKGCGR
jgi:ABC-type sugar transport system substrate-binding protein